MTLTDGNAGVAFELEVVPPLERDTCPLDCHAAGLE